MGGGSRGVVLANKPRLLFISNLRSETHGPAPRNEGVLDMNPTYY